MEHLEPGSRAEVHPFPAMSFFKLKALGGQNATFTLLPFLLDKFNRDYPTQTTRIFGAQSLRKAFGVKKHIYCTDHFCKFFEIWDGMLNPVEKYVQ